jgi:B9 domain-containing protein 2
MPELHIVGEIEGASGFPSQDLFCKWKIEADETCWELLEGNVEGQTQVDTPLVK